MENENFVNRAFNDCSEKIKKLAKILFCIGLVAGVITAIVMFAEASDTWGDGTLYTVLGFASLVVIPLLTWVSCIFLYGFGELIEKAKRLEDKLLPADVDYTTIKGLRLEAQEKLNRIRPFNLGQAGRISGVNPADIAVLMVYLSTRK